MIAYVNALQRRRLFLYLPNSNDQQTGDAFPWASKIEALVSRRSSQAWHGLSSRCFVLFSEGLYSKHALPYLISTHFNSSRDLQYTFALWFTSTAFTMANCFKQEQKKNKTKRTLGLAITSTWSTSLRWGAGSLACSLDCNMFAAPLNMKPPPISRTELYIFRLVSSVAVKNKKFNFRTRRRWTDRIYVKRKNWRSIDYRSVTYHSNWCYVGLLGLDPSFSQKQASCLCYQSLWRLQCPDHVLGLVRYLAQLWSPQICWIDPGFSATTNREAREIT